MRGPGGFTYVMWWEKAADVIWGWLEPLLWMAQRAFFVWFGRSLAVGLVLLIMLGVVRLLFR